MKLYYDNNLSSKVAQIGNGRNKTYFRRLSKKAVVFFLTDIRVNTFFTSVGLIIFARGMF